MGVAENLLSIKKNLPPSVTLVAVSKTKPDKLVMEAYEAGHRDFGENKVQDLVARAERLPGDIRWHMIGHLQSNKAKYLAPFVHMIHGVDSMKLLKVINKEGAKNNRVIECLIQVRIASEETKFGLSGEEALRIVQSPEFRDLKNIRIRGIMGMATYTENQGQIREEFQHLNAIFEDLKATDLGEQDDFDQRSFGMSGDYQLAAEEGTTMVRIGSLIFGPRDY